MASRGLRTLLDLQKECKANGISFLPTHKKDELEVLLRDYYWAKHHPSEQMPEQVEVMLAHKLSDLEVDEQEQIWNSPNWTAEEKLDGCRIIMQISKDGSLRFFGRNKSVKNFLYDEKTDVLPFHSSIKLDTFSDSVFDGELISTNSCVSTGSTDINNSLSACSAILNSEPEIAKEFQVKYGPFKFVIFDVLKFCGTETCSLPFKARRIIREQVEHRMGMLSSIKPDTLFGFVKYTDTNKKEFYEGLVSQGGEGIMLKDLSSKYELGKRRWTLLKVKRFNEYDAFISGFVKSDEDAGFKDYIGAIELSVINEKGQQVVLGNVSAMPLEFRKWATENPGPTCSLNPSLLGKVAVIRGQEFSSKNYHLKHCVFIHGMWDQPIQAGNWLGFFRKDKRPEDCIVNFQSIIKKVNKGERV